jgi:hypothetical protein
MLYITKEKCIFAPEFIYQNHPMPSNINIGSIIREELRRQGRTNKWLAEQIGVNTRTVNKIFLKSVIDTQQLMLISQALHVDFFKLYSEALS